MSLTDVQIVDLHVRAAGCWAIVDADNHLKVWGASRRKEVIEYLRADNFRRARLLKKFLLFEGSR
jgi:hypothetical protein